MNKKLTKEEALAKILNNETIELISMLESDLITIETYVCARGIYEIRDLLSRSQCADSRSD